MKTLTKEDVIEQVCEDVIVTEGEKYIWLGIPKEKLIDSVTEAVNGR